MMQSKIALRASAQPNAPGGRRRRIRSAGNLWLLLMFLPALAYFLIFKYAPVSGMVIAFKAFNLRDGIWHSPWVGLDNFRMLLNSPDILQVIRNTLFISFLSIAVGFPFPILLAILMNEVRRQLFKRTVQTLLYLPHFLNWVIVGSFVVLIFAREHGLVNALLRAATGHDFAFLYNESSWLAIFLGAGIWKEAGFGAIIYLAALSSIDPSLYEAAAMDGAGKGRQMWHVTLPALRPIIVLMLILSLERVMDVSFDKIYVLQNPAVGDISDVISTWSYTVGLRQAQYSLTTALGFFQSLVGLALVLSANYTARRFGQGLW